MWFKKKPTLTVAQQSDAISEAITRSRKETANLPKVPADWTCPKCLGTAVKREYWGTFVDKAYKCVSEYAGDPDSLPLLYVPPERLSVYCAGCSAFLGWERPADFVLKDWERPQVQDETAVK